MPAYYPAEGYSVNRLSDMLLDRPDPSRRGVGVFGRLPGTTDPPACLRARSFRVSSHMSWKRENCLLSSAVQGDPWVEERFRGDDEHPGFGAQL